MRVTALGVWALGPLHRIESDRRRFDANQGLASRPSTLRHLPGCSDNLAEMPANPFALFRRRASEVALEVAAELGRAGVTD